MECATLLLAVMVVAGNVIGSKAVTMDSLVDYPCIKQPGSKHDVIESSLVCDGNNDCPLQDDEYYCDDAGHQQYCVDLAGAEFDSPCCKLIPCLGPYVDGFTSCLNTTRSAPFDYQESNQCPFHQEHSVALQCVNSTEGSTTRDWQVCPWNCICCPLMISCTRASWPQFQQVMSNMTSNVRVRILQFKDLQQFPADRSSIWQAIANMFPYLRHLEFTDTPLMELGAEFAAPFKNLHLLKLNGAGIQRLEKHHFIGMENLTVLALEDNNITDVSNGPFTHLNKLDMLSLWRNPVTSAGIGGSAWEGLDYLWGMRLGRTNVTHLTNTSFRYLSKLQYLYLEITPVRQIEPGTFAATPKLKYFYAVDNDLQVLRKGTFDGAKLIDINIAKSPIRVIEEGAFRNQSAAYLVVLKSMPHLELNRRMLEGLTYEQMELITDVAGMCCLMDTNSSQKCKKTPVTLDFTTCGTLLPYGLKISLWIMAIAAILGNLMVISLRFRRLNESSSQNVQRVLILHLAFADLLMGIYLVIIGVADAQYGEDYFWYTEKWRQTKMCKAAGFLAMLSSEASLFIIVTISIDRFLILVFPFSRVRLRGIPLPITVGAIWCVSILLAALGVPTTTDNNNEVFGQSSVGIALPLLTRYVNDDGEFVFNRDEFSINSSDFNLKSTDKISIWVYSIIVFLGINTACLLLVLICYVWIYISVMRSRKNVSRDANVEEEIRMAIKMAVIVGTDLCCWLPVIILGILTQSHILALTSVVYGWIIVFVLPINSSVNPYLYTLNGSLDSFQKYRARRRLSRGSTVTHRLTRMFSNKGADDNGSNISKHGARSLPTDLTAVSKSSPASRKKGNNNVDYAPVGNN